MSAPAATRPRSWRHCGQPAARWVPAQRIRHLARAAGEMAKTDAVDARMLAEYAARMRPGPTPPPDENLRVLRPPVARRRVLVATRAAERKRRRQVALARVQASVAPRRGAGHRNRGTRSGHPRRHPGLPRDRRPRRPDRDPARHRPGHQRRADCRSARAGTPALGPDRSTRRACATHPPERGLARAQLHLRRPKTGARRPLHGRNQHRLARIVPLCPALQKSARQRKTPLTRPRRRHAKNARHPQCHAPR